MRPQGLAGDFKGSASVGLGLGRVEVEDVCVRRDDARVHRPFIRPAKSNGR